MKHAVFIEGHAMRRICIVVPLVLFTLIYASVFFLSNELHVFQPRPIKGNITKNTTKEILRRITTEEKVLLLFWSKLWRVPAKIVERVWKKGDEIGECPVACEVTIDKSRAKQANAFIVHARDPHPLPPSNYKSMPWVLTTLENPVYTPVLQNPSYMSQFNLLRSYRLDSDFAAPGFRKPNLSPPVPFKNKTGNIMAVFSNCERVRTEYLRQLMKFIKIDSYGGCLKNKQGLVRRNGANFQDSKSKMSRNYKFLIVFFNQDCDYFIDEKLHRAMNAGAVPIVMSTDKIKEFLPGNLNHSIVNVRDFKSPKHLAERLKYLLNNETEYNKYLDWKIKGFDDISNTVIGRHLFRRHAAWCQICVAISEGRWHKNGLKPDICKPRSYSTWKITPGG